MCRCIHTNRYMSTGGTCLFWTRKSDYRVCALNHSSKMPPRGVAKSGKYKNPELPSSHCHSKSQLFKEQLSITTTQTLIEKVVHHSRLKKESPHDGEEGWRCRIVKIHTTEGWPIKWEIYHNCLSSSPHQAPSQPATENVPLELLALKASRVCIWESWRATGEIDSAFQEHL